MFFIKSLDYEEKYYDKNTKTINHWKLSDLKFSKFSIIAGLNSVGKSRTCRVIRNTCKKIIEPMKVLQVGNTNLIVNTSEDRSYRIVINIEEDENLERRITKEELYEDGEQERKLLFNRETIYDDRLKDYTNYSPPDNYLTFHARRDKVSYPYLEQIINESKKFYFLNFEEPKTIAIPVKVEEFLPIDISPSLTPIYVDKMYDTLKQEILDDINSFDFPIKNMFTKPVIIRSSDGSDREFKVPMIYFEEMGVEGIYDFINASSGMSKIVFLIVFLHLAEKGSCILIDNAGDGLDYKRSINILPILEKIAEEKQIIICTNNEILLNQTDIRNWNILYREGSNVKAYNFENSKEKLLKFSETGLSNYEYFQDKYFLK